VDYEDLGEIASLEPSRTAELIDLDDAMHRLHAQDPRRCRIVELRVFAGLSVEETAELLEVSPQTVMRDWKLAKAWLQRELSGRSG
jgi:RNA polymerase sigma factor (sigma-70 family)